MDAFAALLCSLDFRVTLHTATCSPVPEPEVGGERWPCARYSNESRYSTKKIHIIRVYSDHDGMYVTSSMSMNGGLYSSSMLEGVLRLVQLGLEGSRSNWFGLGCPAFCYQPSFAAYLLIFICGTLFGLGLSGLLLWTLWTWLVLPPAPLPASHPQTSSRYSALAEYAHEQSPMGMRGRSSVTLPGPQ